MKFSPHLHRQAIATDCVLCCSQTVTSNVYNVPKVSHYRLDSKQTVWTGVGPIPNSCRVTEAIAAGLDRTDRGPCLRPSDTITGSDGDGNSQRHADSGGARRSTRLGQSAILVRDKRPVVGYSRSIKIDNATPYSVGSMSITYIYSYEQRGHRASGNLRSRGRDTGDRSSIINGSHGVILCHPRHSHTPGPQVARHLTVHKLRGRITRVKPERTDAVFLDSADLVSILPTGRRNRTFSVHTRKMLRKSITSSNHQNFHTSKHVYATKNKYNVPMSSLWKIWENLEKTCIGARLYLTQQENLSSTLHPCRHILHFYQTV